MMYIEALKSLRCLLSLFIMNEISPHYILCLVYLYFIPGGCWYKGELFICKSPPSNLTELFYILLIKLKELVQQFFSWVSWFSGYVMVTQKISIFFSISIFFWLHCLTSENSVNSSNLGLFLIWMGLPLWYFTF